MLLKDAGSSLAAMEFYHAGWICCLFVCSDQRHCIPSRVCGQTWRCRRWSYKYFFQLHWWCSWHPWIFVVSLLISWITSQCTSPKYTGCGVPIVMKNLRAALEMKNKSSVKDCKGCIRNVFDTLALFVVSLHIGWNTSQCTGPKYTGCRVHFVMQNLRAKLEMQKKGSARVCQVCMDDTDGILWL